MLYIYIYIYIDRFARACIFHTYWSTIFVFVIFIEIILMNLKIGKSVFFFKIWKSENIFQNIKYTNILQNLAFLKSFLKSQMSKYFSKSQNIIIWFFLLSRFFVLCFFFSAIFLFLTLKYILYWNSNGELFWALLHKTQFCEYSSLAYDSL